MLAFVLFSPFWRVLGTLAFALFLYYFARPVSAVLGPRIGRRRGAALALFLVVLPFVVVLGLFVLTLVGQVQAIENVDPQGLLDALEPFVDTESLPRSVDELVAAIRLARPCRGDRNRSVSRGETR